MRSISILIVSITLRTIKREQSIVLTLMKRVASSNDKVPAKSNDLVRCLFQEYITSSKLERGNGQSMCLHRGSVSRCIEIWKSSFRSRLDLSAGWHQASLASFNTTMMSRQFISLIDNDHWLPNSADLNLLSYST